MQLLGSAPPRREIPLTLGCDFTFIVELADPTTGDPVDYPGTVRMDIDAPAGPTTINASIDANVATLVLPATICDKAGTTTRYRVLNVATDGTATPLVVGTFVRYD
jgi:hypothetical protein